MSQGDFSVGEPSIWMGCGHIADRFAVDVCFGGAAPRWRVKAHKVGAYHRRCDGSAGDSRRLYFLLGGSGLTWPRGGSATTSDAEVGRKKARISELYSRWRNE